MEILIGVVVIVAALYFIWSRSDKTNTLEKTVDSVKTETYVGSDIAITIPVEEKPVKKPRTTKSKVSTTEAKPKTPRKPRMKVVK